MSDDPIVTAVRDALKHAEPRGWHQIAECAVEVSRPLMENRALHQLLRSVSEGLVCMTCGLAATACIAQNGTPPTASDHVHVSRWDALGALMKVAQAATTRAENAEIERDRYRAGLRAVVDCPWGYQSRYIEIAAAALKDGRR